MKTWQEDQLSTLQSMLCENELFLALTKIAQELGFDYCAYGLRTSLPLCKPRTTTLNNYPVAWQTRYLEQNYLAIDPTVRHGLNLPIPVVWPDNSSAETSAFWEDAQSFGLKYGWALSSRDARGNVGMLTLARSYEELTDREYRDKGLKMAWLAHTAHQLMSRLLMAPTMPEASAQLTSQEVRVLRWTADGKTSGEISDILDISERVVNFHIRNAMLKLGAVNKTAAAVRAALLGMLA